MYLPTFGYNPVNISTPFKRYKRMNFVYKEKDVLKKGEFKLIDFRKEDYKNIMVILKQIFEISKRMNPDNFEYSIKHVEKIKPYLNINNSHIDNIEINMKYGENSKKIILKYPVLVDGNFFQFFDSKYLPILMLEKKPIDILNLPDKNKHLVHIHLNPSLYFVITKVPKEDKYTIYSNLYKETIPLENIAKVFFSDEQLEYLYQNGVLEENEVVTQEKQLSVNIGNLLNFSNSYLSKPHSMMLRENLSLSEFLKEVFILPYYREFFMSEYGADDIGDLMMIGIKKILSDEDSDLSNLNNRYISFSTRMLKTVFDLHTRLVDTMTKHENEKLPNINTDSLIVSGFKVSMGGKMMIGNNGLPHLFPWADKISQSITQSSSGNSKDPMSGKIPKSWTNLDSTQFGLIDPLNVSPKNMGTTIKGTSNMILDKFGRILNPNSKTL
jgi:hypothetical protein